jgi:hypothetical protein
VTAGNGELRVYGVPANLDLSFLQGAELTQVCIGQLQLQFHFHPTGSICVTGDWELRDAAGDRIDGRHDDDPPERGPFHFHRLLGRKVVRFEVFAPEWFALHFEGGDVLKIFDNDPHYECFEIQPGDIFV